MKIFGRWHLVKAPDVKRKPGMSVGELPLNVRAEKWMDKYFGSARKMNPEKLMDQRFEGFKDGYHECLIDLKLLRYPKQS